MQIKTINLELMSTVEHKSTVAILHPVKGLSLFDFPISFGDPSVICLLILSHQYN